ncbi:MAG: shikimate dehydrogenase [Thermoleophilia bacterium]|nr:shikimate dehydrogenase [Thermoleophilia bacterium]
MVPIRATTTLVGLLAWPASHSLSPPMQNAGFAALGLDWAYVPLPTPPERLGDAVRGLVATGFAGANVTIPHKTAVLDHCDEVEADAAAASSVNTLRIVDGRVLGSSTDIAALRAAFDAGGRRVLVLGRGGAAKAAAQAYRGAGAAEVVLAGRRDVGWPPSPEGFDAVVNCTPLSDEAVVTLTGHEAVVDMAYRPDGRETALVAAARAAGCACIVDGLDLLLAQGAVSFARWTGVAAPLEAMRAGLRQ